MLIYDAYILWLLNRQSQNFEMYITLSFLSYHYKKSEIVAAQTSRGREGYPYLGAIILIILSDKRKYNFSVLRKVKVGPICDKTIMGSDSFVYLH